MPRPKAINKRVVITAWVPPGVRIALNDLARKTRKSRSELIEEGIGKLFNHHLKNTNENEIR